MSDEKKPSVFEMQMEINEMLGKRIDLTDKWLSEMTGVVKVITERLLVLENAGCACKKGEM
jgi:hypothetical protein